MLDRCDQSRAEYYTLTKANMARRVREDHFERLMQITREVKEATGLLDLASRISAEAVLETGNAIARARDL